MLTPIVEYLIAGHHVRFRQAGRAVGRSVQVRNQRLPEIGFIVHAVHVDHRTWKSVNVRAPPLRRERIKEKKIRKNERTFVSHLRCCGPTTDTSGGCSGWVIRLSSRFFPPLLWWSDALAVRHALRGSSPRRRRCVLGHTAPRALSTIKTYQPPLARVCARECARASPAKYVV